jgi:hypothetical protein
MRKIKIKIKYYILDFILKKFSKNKLFERILNNEEKQAIKSINNGFLSEIGWWNSWRTREPQDANGKPLPWVTYSYIHFIEERLTKEMVVFEFGTGNSTLFYSNIVKQIDSVEHDEEWYKKMNHVLPKNANIFFEKLEYGGDYSKMAFQMKKKYELISVDGRDRVNSLMSSLQALTSNGVLVLDDSERKAYQKGIEFLRSQGFKRLDFWGISPGLFYKKCTSIFYRTSNVLNI